jgi:hypothetical protein
LAEIDHRCVLRAWAAIGAVVRDALSRAGSDPGAAYALRRVAAAEAELAAIPDTGNLRDADEAFLALHDEATDDGADLFVTKMRDLTARFADGEMPDLADASLAMLFAWSLAQPDEPMR